MASKPLTIPNVFASEGTGTPNNIPLLDADFTQVANYFNDGSFFSTRGIDTGAANAYVVTLPSGYVPSAYNVGMRLVFNPGNSNTGASTINVNALGSQTILTANGSVLAGSEITAGYDCDLVYDGTNFRVMSLAIPQITSVRLRSFNAVGNSTMECDQINIGSTVANAGNVKIIDRWKNSKSGTMQISAGQQVAGAGDVKVPGTTFYISSNFLRFTLTTAQATLGASDYWQVFQIVEGTQMRELFDGSGNSIQVLVRSSVAGLKFGLTLQDNNSTHSLAKLCTITSANAWTLVQLPNLPIWVSGGSWGGVAGSIGYYFIFALAAGTSQTVAANDTWQNTSAFGAVGQSNFAASPVNSTFDIAFVQHEPGPLCTTLQDKPFSVNYDECLRHYQKTYLYGTAPGTATTAGCINFYQLASLSPTNPIRYIKPMAKVPTTTIYSTATGASGNVRDYTAGADKAITGINNNGDAGYSGVAVSSPNASNWNVAWQHTADTGW